LDGILIAAGEWEWAITGLMETWAGEILTLIILGFMIRGRLITIRFIALMLTILGQTIMDIILGMVTITVGIVMDMVGETTAILVGIQEEISYKIRRDSFQEEKE
jgi:hypothetical protein